MEQCCIFKTRDAKIQVSHLQIVISWVFLKCVEEDSGTQQMLKESNIQFTYSISKHEFIGKDSPSPKWTGCLPRTPSQLGFHILILSLPISWTTQQSVYWHELLRYSVSGLNTGYPRSNNIFQRTKNNVYLFQLMFPLTISTPCAFIYILMLPTTGLQTINNFSEI